MSEDALTVIRLQGGDIDALAILYDRYKAQVYRTALAITRDSAAAEDILQDCFLRLHKYAHRVDPTLPLLPWLYRVTVNLSRTWLSRHKLWKTSIEDLFEHLISPVRLSPENAAVRSDIQQLLQKALDSLDFNHRVVVVLHYLNDLSLKEIAYVVDCPVGTVKSRLHYGREQLRRYLTSNHMVSQVVYDYT
jgi:RNA polymerase sigma-70 factor (ECF subfamily)